MKRVFKRSELEGVTGWRDNDDKTVRLYPEKIVLSHDEAMPTIFSPKECENDGDTRLTAQPLIDAIKALGYEVVDDLAVKADHVPDIGKMIARIADLERQLADKPRTYTAREWLDRMMPRGGVWQHNNENVFHHPHPKHKGRSYSLRRMLAVSECLHAEGDGAMCAFTQCDRSTAIDLMVKAIEGGDQPAQPAPAYKVGDRVEVVSIKGNRIGTITSDTPHMGGCYVSIDGAESGWVGYSCLQPAPAEQKPGLDYAKIAKALGTTISEAPPNVKMACAVAGVALAAPEAAKVDTLTKLAEVLRDALGEQWTQCRNVANAIDAHITARMKA